MSCANSVMLQGVRQPRPSAVFAATAVLATTGLLFSRERSAVAVIRGAVRGPTVYAGMLGCAVGAGQARCRLGGRKQVRLMLTVAAAVFRRARAPLGGYVLRAPTIA